MLSKLIVVVLLFSLYACAPYPTMKNRSVIASPDSVKFDERTGDVYVSINDKYFKLNIYSDIYSPSNNYKVCTPPYRNFTMRVDPYKNITKTDTTTNVKYNLQNVKIIELSKYPDFSKIEESLKNAQIMLEYGTDKKNKENIFYLYPNKENKQVLYVLPDKHFVKASCHSHALILHIKNKARLFLLSELYTQESHLGMEIFLPGFDDAF